MRIKELRYWVQKVLPLVYDDSLSYYELLNRVVVKLNEVIQLANGIDERIDEEVNTILNEWLENGTFEELIDQEVLTDLNNKIDSTIEDVGNLEETVGGISTEVGDLDERVDALESSPSTVVTPQSVGYPESKTADEAFSALAGFTDKPIVIPEGTYNLSEEHILNNVVLDMGSYGNYVPMYKRKNNINLQSFGAGHEIVLPSKTSYVEAMCYLDGFYYASVYDYSSANECYITKYNSQFTQVAITYIARSLSPNAPANIYTDGTYLYVDFVGTTLKYDTSLNLVSTISASGIWFTAWFNGYFWGTNFNNSIVSVYKMNSSFTILDSHVFNFGYPTQDPQSMTVHNGLMYLTTTDGYFAVIDMFDWSYELIYYTSQMEIEKIMFVDDAAWYVGHDYGIDGKFRVGAFNGGQTIKTFGMYEIDGNNNNVNFGSPNKFGVYKFTNLQIGNYGNSGTLVICDDIAYAKIGDYWYAKYSGGDSWWLCGADAKMIIGTLANGLYIYCTTGGEVMIQAINYTQGTSEVSINRDNSDIFNLRNISTSTDRTVNIFGRDASNQAPGCAIAIARIVILHNRVIIRPTVLAGSATEFIYNDTAVFM